MLDKINMRIEAITLVYLHKNAEGKSPEELAGMYLDARKKVKSTFNARRKEVEANI